VVNIFDNFFKERKRFFYKKPKQLDRKLKQELTKINNEFEEHLRAINENTSEIQSNHEYLCEIDAKINKMGERIDNMQLFLQSNSNFIVDGEKTFEVKPLTRTEQDIFMVLYALEDELGLVSYGDISRKTDLSYSLISNYITSMIEKGIPILKKYVNNRPFLKLDQEFKIMQAKENLLMIDPAQKRIG